MIMGGFATDTLENDPKGTNADNSIIKYVQKFLQGTVHVY